MKAITKIGKGVIIDVFQKNFVYQNTHQTDLSYGL